MRRWFSLWAPLFVFTLLAPFTPLLDMRVAHYFYTPDKGFVDTPLCRFLFHYGEIFGFVVCGIAILLFLFSWLIPHWQRWRQGLFAILLSFLLGPGLLVNALLKDQLARPRPKQVETFGGKYAYRPFWKLSLQQRKDPQKSFPSGHVAMGFYFLSLSLVGKRVQNRPLYFLGILVSVVLGGSLMVVRMAQGGHFLSDVLAAPLVIWYVSLFVDWWTWGGTRWERLLFWVERVFRLKIDQGGGALPCDQPYNRKGPRQE